MTELTLKDVLEGMADFESRISLLENQHTPSDASLQNPQEDVPVVATIAYGLRSGDHIVRDDLDKLRALFVNLKNQFNEHTNKKRTNSKYLYTSIVNKGVTSDTSENNRS